MTRRSVSIGKVEEGLANEDAVLAKDNLIAVSDGAGGGGLFADLWSRYLLYNLPDTPIRSAEELDSWIETIWEPFYKQCEEKAISLGGIYLNKFYDEGSFATLVAVWKTAEKECQWISYGDSVAFHYNYATKTLQHSFGEMSGFDKPPFLINCKDELSKDGFKHGHFNVDESSVVFAASDALAHYIIMMYEVCCKNVFLDEIENAILLKSKNSNYICMALKLKNIDFEKDVLSKLFGSSANSANFFRHTRKLQRNGLLAYDDYSLVIM